MSSTAARRATPAAASPARTRRLRAAARLLVGLSAASMLTVGGASSSTASVPESLDQCGYQQGQTYSLAAVPAADTTNFTPTFTRPANADGLGVTTDTSAKTTVIHITNDNPDVDSWFLLDSAGNQTRQASANNGGRPESVDLEIPYSSGGTITITGRNDDTLETIDTRVVELPSTNVGAAAAVTSYCYVTATEAPAELRLFWLPTDAPTPADGTHWIVSFNGVNYPTNKPYVDVPAPASTDWYPVQITAVNADGAQTPSGQLGNVMYYQRADAPDPQTISTSADADDVTVTIDVPAGSLDSRGGPINSYLVEVDRDGDGIVSGVGEIHLINRWDNPENAATVSTVFRDLPLGEHTFRVAYNNEGDTGGPGSVSFYTSVNATVSSAVPFVVPEVSGVSATGGLVHDSSTETDVPGVTVTWPTVVEEADTTFYLAFDGKFDELDTKRVWPQNEPWTFVASDLGLSAGEHTVQVKRTIDIFDSAWSAPVTFTVPSTPTPPVVTPPVTTTPVTTPPVTTPPVTTPPVTTPPVTTTPKPGNPVKNADGSTTYTSPSGARVVVTGAIQDAYNAAGAGSASIGLPTQDAFGIKDGGLVQRFEHGLVYSKDGAGTHIVTGAVQTFFAAKGWEQSSLGYPTSDLIAIREGGSVQRFEGGLIYTSSAGGTHEVSGAFGELYAGKGWENSSLGYPTSDEIRIKDGGVVQRYQGGLLYWTPTTGAHEVSGAIQDAYSAAGWENSSLGYPVGGSYQVPSGLRQDFQGGSITTPNTK